MTKTYILTLSCEDCPGIVAEVATSLRSFKGNILESQQYTDIATNRFFMRLVFSLPDNETSERVISESFAPVAERFAITWQMRPQDQVKRVVLFVSKFDHCLADLLYRTRIGELRMEVLAIVSNHPPSALHLTTTGDIPYHHFPVTRETKPQQEAEIARVIDELQPDWVILARYMQILSKGLTQKLAGRCINIHHSFLPGFKGARPYHQAHERGVKMIGATAHFVTADLDEGPIITQDVETITHADTPADLIQKGRSIEERVLTRAVSYLIDDRVFLNGNTTIVFAK